MLKLNKEEINKIVLLRRKGKTLNEIKNIVNRGKGTVYKYIKNIKIDSDYQGEFNEKRFPSKVKSKKEWEFANKWSRIQIGKLSDREIILISCMLYWGEGNKKYELNLINSDHNLIRIFIKGLILMGVEKNRIKISLRIFKNIDKNKAIKFWLNKLSLTKDNLISVNIIEGSKNGKLEFGMCRVRVEKGSLYFKQIISIIENIKLL